VHQANTATAGDGDLSGAQDVLAREGRIAMNRAFSVER
jgi:hypothetical protein